MSTHKEWQIFVRGLSRTVVLDCHGGMTIAELKQQIADKEGMPPQMQRLTIGTTVLNDSRTVLDYNLTKEKTIQCTGCVARKDVRNLVGSACCLAQRR